MPSLRVVPPYNPRGLLPLAATLGAVSGVLTLALFVWLTTNYRVIDTPVYGLVLLVHLAVLPPLVAGALLARFTQHPRLTTVVGLVFGAAQAAGFLAYTFTTSETGGATAATTDLYISLALLAVFSSLGCGLFHLARFLTRSLLFNTIEQTGTLCHRCGYDRAAPSIAVCPECAAPADPSSFRARRFLAITGLAHRVARPLAAALLLIGVAAAANTLITRTIPAARFVRTFRAAGAHISLWYITPLNWPNWPPGTRSAGAVGAWLPFPDGSDRTILVLYAPDRDAPEPAMQIVVAAVPSSHSRHVYPDHGSPHIALNLPRHLAEHVAREGLPLSLARAIADHADSSGWKPAGGAGPVLIVSSEIDLAPHFPSE